MANKVKWLGHATFEIETSKGKTIIIDPWYNENPSNKVNAEEVKKADIVLVTHDHFDHIGDAATIVKNTGAILVAQPEVANKLKESGVPAEKVVNGVGMNTGGTVDIDGVKVTMVQAFHSAVNGDPCGYIITLEDGKTIYHAGDTGIFSSMELFGRIYNIDLALLPIGCVFTMDPVQAAFALTLLNPKAVIPMHYKSFPILVQDADEFVKLAGEKAPGVKVVVLDSGESYEL